MSNAIDQMVELGDMAEAMEGVASPPPAEVAALFQGFGGLLLSLGWLLPVSILVGAMLAAAVARGVLNPRAGGFGYLRLGMDELRVVVVTVVLSILMVAAIFALAVVVGIVIALTRAAGGGRRRGACLPARRPGRRGRARLAGGAPQPGGADHGRRKPDRHLRFLRSGPGAGFWPLLGNGDPRLRDGPSSSAYCPRSSPCPWA
ncbi:MAG: hypothetical protein KL785_04305 [Brevundimonas sp.]|nr:hypothetical protein [Brevundimonas sp.]